MSDLVALPPQPAGLEWPTEDWPVGDLPAGVDLAPLLDDVFDNEGPMAETFAVLVVHRGRLVVERYQGALEHFDRPPTRVTADTPLLSWSIAKSILHAVVGLLVGQGRLDLDAPAAVPEWAAPDDPRHAITVRQMLAIRDGLDFVEDYVDDRISDTMQMLFGDGQADMAHFAADRPLTAPPGERFNYSSGTSNVISGVVARTVGPGESYAAVLAQPALRPTRDDERRPRVRRGRHLVGLLLPTGQRPRLRPLRVALPPRRHVGRRAHPPGRLGGLRAHHGVGGRQRGPPSPYGAHWLGVRGETLDTLNPWGTFRASGYEGQTITICPALDLMVVRLGKTAHEREDFLVPWRAAVVQAFADAG